jgi:hypothetical protein
MGSWDMAAGFTLPLMGFGDWIWVGAAMGCVFFKLGSLRNTSGTFSFVARLSFYTLQ